MDENLETLIQDHLLRLVTTVELVVKVSLYTFFSGLLALMAYRIFSIFF